MSDLIVSIKKKIINLSYTQTGHIAGSLSSLEITFCLFKYFYNNLKNNIVISKGHSAVGVYSVLNSLGIISEEDLETYGKNGSLLIGHVNHKVKGISYSSGALGNGLGVGLGMALSDKFYSKNENVYVLMSDGELNEGSSMEAFQFAGQNKLDNLIVIVDNNDIQASNFTKNIISTNNIIDAVEKFGWEIINCEDGHDIEKIKKCLETESKGLPKLIIAKTIKGNGFSFMENSPSWHHKQLNEEEYNIAMEILND